MPQGDQPTTRVHTAPPCWEHSQYIHVTDMDSWNGFASSAFRASATSYQVTAGDWLYSIGASSVACDHSSTYFTTLCTAQKLLSRESTKTQGQTNTEVALWECMPSFRTQNGHCHKDPKGTGMPCHPKDKCMCLEARGGNKISSLYHSW